MSDPALAEPPAPPTAPPAGPLADLILVRLLPAKASVSIADISQGVGEAFQRPPSQVQVAEAVSALKQAGLITAGRSQRLTDAGRIRALAYLGVAELPPKANWGTVKAKYLVPRALGLSPTSPDDAKVFGDADKLAALLLKRKFALPAGTGATLNTTFEALACKWLGFPDHVSLRTLVPAVISREMRFDPPLTPETLTESGPVSILDAPRHRNAIDRFRAVALRNWATNGIAPDQAVESEPFDLEAFADTVKSAARTCPTGRFGDNKVFISHVWRQLQDEPRFAPLGLAGFKQKLVEANREDRLTLSRADLVQVMDPADVRESEAEYLNAVFHFILVEG